MEETETREKRPQIAERMAQMFITEAICVAVLLLAVIAMKYWLTGYYAAAADWYSQNICTDTDIDEVINTVEEDDAD